MSNAQLTLLIDHYAADMKLRNLSPLTVEYKTRTLKRFVKGLAPRGERLLLKHLTPDRVKGYVAGLQSRETRYADHPIRAEKEGELTPLTVASEVQVLKAFGAWLKRERLPNPFETLKIPKRPKVFVDVLSDDEVGKLLDSVNPDTPTGARAYAMMILMLDSGMRIGEIVGTRLEALDLERRRMLVMGKGSKERFVRFGMKCAKALLRYINLFRPQPAVGQPDCLFLALDGLPLTTNAARRIVLRIGRRAEVTRLHPHLFRHTFAVNYVLNGGDIMTLKELLGHETLTTVMRYQHYKQSQVAQAYDNYSPMDKMMTATMRRFGSRRRTPEPT